MENRRDHNEGAEEYGIARISKKEFGNGQIAEAVAHAYEVMIWKSSAKHYLGNGLQKGIPDLEPGKKAKKELL